MPRPLLRTLPLLPLLLALGSSAHAQSGESPQRFAIEIKFGPYLPHIDDSPGLDGKTPFSDTFGNWDDPKGANPNRALLSQLEFDYQILRTVGILGVGLSAGYYRKSAEAPLYFGKSPPLTTCTLGAGADGGSRTYKLPTNTTGSFDQAFQCFSADENYLNIVPLALMAVYRFDWLDRRFGWPIIPYVKAGLAYYLWWNGTSNDFVAKIRYDPAGNPISNDQTSASGGTFGLVVHPGLAIDLGAIDRQSARVMDREMGLNRVTAFVELNYAWINNFGAPANRTIGNVTRPSTLNLSDLSFNAGLGFEF